MNEITIERSEAEIALEINIIKRKTAQDVLSSAIEIGRLLCEAKEKVEHGKWGDWLRDNVAYSISNANNMMRLFHEREAMNQIDLFGSNDVDVFEGLNLSQAIALLSLPRSQRKNFVEENNVSEMSVRDLQNAIKEKNEAEERAREAERRASVAEARSEEISQTLDELTEEKDELSKTLEETSAELEKIKALPISEDERAKIEEEAAARAEIEAEKKIASAKAKADKAIEKAKKESEAAKKKAEEDWAKEKESIIAEIRKKAEEEVAEKTRALEEKIKQNTIASSPFLIRFKTHMEAFQDAYSRMAQTVCEAERQEPETGSKLRNALAAIKETLNQGGNNG